LIIKELTVGPIQANCFIVGCEDTLKAAVIDPGDEADRILIALSESNLKAEYIINTHGHFDHVGANNRVKEVTGASIVIHSLDAMLLSHVSSSASAWGVTVANSPEPDKKVEHGDTISVGNIVLNVIHTPGHTPGGISLYTEDAVFSGDTLFAGSIGRTDFPGGDHQTLISSIQDRLFMLPDNTKVYPGHMTSTSIGTEKRTNPFVRTE
jgi:glyoxylase-like metal-dependent hydrolase (beta-lactamase superfamily II)